MSIYRAIARWVIGCATRPVVIIDWPDLDLYKRHFLLRAALPLGGRASTRYEEVHTLKTKEKPKTHRAFLHLKDLLPRGCRPVVANNAGFKTPWFKEVEQLGWDWVGRIRARHYLQFAGTSTWVGCKSLYSKASASPKGLGTALLTRSNPCSCQLIL